MSGVGGETAPQERPNGGWMRAQAEAKPELQTPFGNLHGGVMAATCDHMLGCVCYQFQDQVNGPDGQPVEVKQILWDVEGGLQRESLLDSYLRGAAGAIVVGDLSREDPLTPMRENAGRILVLDG